MESLRITLEPLVNILLILMSICVGIAVVFLVFLRMKYKKYGR